MVGIVAICIFHALVPFCGGQIANSNGGDMEHADRHACDMTRNLHFMSISSQCRVGVSLIDSPTPVCRQIAALSTE